ncbi:MAG: hypothetical protein ACNA8L_00450 [Luteolibacter sp.]|jgi:hypothetical protein
MVLSIPEFVFAVLACCGSAVVVVSLVSRWRHARAEAKSLKERVICRLCLHAFADDQYTPRGRVIDCPICGTANEKGG